MLEDHILEYIRRNPGYTEFFILNNAITIEDEYRPTNQEFLDALDHLEHVGHIYKMQNAIFGENQSRHKHIWYPVSMKALWENYNSYWVY